MIKGLYETHLYVENLENSINFYTKVLGLKQCRLGKERRTAFFWIGEDKQAMLGLWEKPKEEIDLRHFAFECDPDGHYLEFIGILPGKTKSNEEKRVVTYEQWLDIKEE